MKQMASRKMAQHSDVSAAAAMALALALVLAATTLPPTCTATTATTAVTVDPALVSGNVFGGVGGASGGGGGTRLLIDYPEQQKQQILDMLFKPKHGASLQVTWCQCVRASVVRLWCVWCDIWHPAGGSDTSRVYTSVRRP